MRRRQAEWGKHVLEFVHWNLEPELLINCASEQCTVEDESHGYAVSKKGVAYCKSVAICLL